MDSQAALSRLSSVCSVKIPKDSSIGRLALTSVENCRVKAERSFTATRLKNEKVNSFLRETSLICLLRNNRRASCSSLAETSPLACLPVLSIPEYLYSAMDVNSRYKFIELFIVPKDRYGNTL